MAWDFKEKEEAMTQKLRYFRTSESINMLALNGLIMAGVIHGAPVVEIGQKDKFTMGGDWGTATGYNKIIDWLCENHPDKFTMEA